MSHVSHLRALQTFNEVAKAENLTRAAERLNVTQGAVSHQIGILEKYVGYQMLERHSSGVTLTARGKQLFASTNPAFELLETGVAHVSRKTSKQALTISLPTALATKWFVPRLPLFKRLFPDLGIYLDTTDELIDFDTSEIDVAIRFAKPADSNYYVQKIRDETVVAVVSPRLFVDVVGNNPHPTIHDFPILEDVFDPKWEEWAHLANIPSDRPLTPTVRYKDSAVMVSAAIDGQGVALVRKIMIEDDLAHGRLRRFDDIELPLERALLFCCRTYERNDPGIAALRKWLVELKQ